MPHLMLGLIFGLALGFVLGVALTVRAASLDHSGPLEGEAPYAEARIAQCWAASQEDLNSDNALRIGEGLAATIDCLEREIVLTVEASLECAPRCGSAFNNAGAFELAERLEGVLRDLVAGHQR